MRLTLTSLVALVALVAPVAPVAPAGSVTPEPGRVSQLVTDFGLRLFREAVAARGDANVALSPYGATSLLVALQVATAGRGRRQLEEATGFSVDGAGVPAELRGLRRALRGPGGSLEVSQALLVARGVALSPGAVTRLGRALGPLGVARMEFGEGARGAINAWARERTRGLVPQLVPPGALGPRARLALASALSLSATWAVPVPAGATRARPFRRPDGTEVTVPMVALEGRFGCGDFATPSGVPFSVLDVPYAGMSLSLLLVAPLSRDVPAAALAPLLRARGVTAWATALSPAPRRVLLPRFSLESSWDLRGPLRALGVSDPFDPERADFTPLTGEPHLALGPVLHQVRLEVTENGTEAAAASAAVVHSRMAPLEILMDRPFLFLIRHRPTGTVLFVGQLTEP